MLYRLPLLLARRVAGPAALPRPLLTRAFSYTPIAFSPAKDKTASKPKTASKTKAKSATTTKAKDAPKTKAKAETKGRKKGAKAAKKPAYSRAELKVPTRRPPSSYVIFINEQFAKATKPTTREEAKEMMKTYAAQWKALSQEQQQVYKDKSAELGKKIVAEYEAWANSVDPAVLRQINKQRKSRGKNKIHVPSTGPKRPLPAFLQFLSEYRAEHPGVTGRQIGVDGGAAWRQLPQTKRDVYILAYQNAKREFEARA